jgi:DNA-binding NtrC family response regulator
MKILFAWIGNTDLKAAIEKSKPGSGPIAQVLTKRKFDRVVLLSDHGKKSNDKFIVWLRKSTSSPIDIHHAKLTSPTSFSEIYELARGVIQDVTKDKDGDTELVFHLSPGTPAMAAVWIILAKTRFPAELVESSREAGVQTTSLPFDIAADYIPDLLRKPDEELVRLSEGLPDDAPEFKDIIHRSAKMKRLIALARKAAPRNIPILIQGESGTGKELFARAIHQASPYKKSGEFVTVNCGAIPKDLVEAELFGHEKGAFTGATHSREGYIEKASGGTLFLDEIGELPLEIQVKLLRVIQEKEVVRVGSTRPRSVNFRVISATNKNLLKEVSAGTFREDLFYRLGVGILSIPSLRDREGDVGLLIDNLLEKINKESVGQPEFVKRKLSVAARSTLIQHGWPGNVRELMNTLTAVTVFSPTATLQKIDVENQIHILPGNERHGILDRPLGEGLGIDGLMEEVAAHYIKRALKETGGHKSRAAKLLGFSNHQTLTNWMARYGLNL